MDRGENQKTWLNRMTESLYGLTLSERQLRNRRRGRFIFTDKKHPWRGVFSVIIGTLSLLSMILSVTMTYYSRAAASGSYSFGIVLAFGYGVAGLTMAVLSLKEREIYPLFPRIGIAINVIAILGVVGITYLGFTT